MGKPVTLVSCHNARNGAAIRLWQHNSFYHECDKKAPPQARGVSRAHESWCTESVQNTRALLSFKFLHSRHLYNGHTAWTNTNWTHASLRQPARHFTERGYSQI